MNPSGGNFKYTAKYRVGIKAARGNRAALFPTTRTCVLISEKRSAVRSINDLSTFPRNVYDREGFSYGDSSASLHMNRVYKQEARK